MQCAIGIVREPAKSACGPLYGHHSAGVSRVRYLDDENVHKITGFVRAVARLQDLPYGHKRMKVPAGDQLPVRRRTDLWVGLVVAWKQAVAGVAIGEAEVASGEEERRRTKINWTRSGTGGAYQRFHRTASQLSRDGVHVRMHAQLLYIGSPPATRPLHSPPCITQKPALPRRAVIVRHGRARRTTANCLSPSRSTCPAKERVPPAG
jgi:hypothetical protein